MRTHFISAMPSFDSLFRTLLPPTAPPTAAPTTTNTITVATTKNVFSFIPNNILGGRLSLTKACLPR